MRLITGVIILFLVVALIVWRKKQRASEKAAADRKSIDLMATNSKFHAVSIRPGIDACEAARGLEGQRFLSDAAPSIPLPGCDSHRCQCRFVHFADRRSGDDRRSPYPTTIGLDAAAHRQDQRQPGDRRKEPPHDW